MCASFYNSTFSNGEEEFREMKCKIEKQKASCYVPDIKVWDVLEFEEKFEIRLSSDTEKSCNGKATP